MASEADVLVTVLGELRAALTAASLDIPVNTESGERAIHVPGIVVSSPQFVPAQQVHGHQTYAGTTTDGAGTETGTEHHFYYWFEANIVARSEDEEQVDDILDVVFTHFAPNVDDPRAIHADFSQLAIEQATRRVDTLREPDWFESGRLLRILFVRRLTQGHDALAAVDEVIDGDAFETA